MIVNDIDNVITMVDALVDKCGIDKCVYAVAIIKQLNQIRKEVSESVENQTGRRE